MRARRFIGFVGFVFCVALTAVTSGGPIQDNSFLIEEAYNQERGVVQHISAFSRTRESDEWAYTFTQEWPAPTERHQLSYTLQVVSPADSGAGTGDLLLNWRYQLVGSGASSVAFAPRVSLQLPSGDEREGRGAGAMGLQANLPLSIAIGQRFASHVNLGATHVPRTKGVSGDEADTTQWSFGQSLVWLARPRFNVMAEVVFGAGEAVVGPDETENEQSLFVNPGIRWAHNRRGGLQIVPGIAMPIGVGPSSGEQAIFFYLSFEHPFTKVARASSD